MASARDLFKKAPKTDVTPHARALMRLCDKGFEYAGDCGVRLMRALMGTYVSLVSARTTKAPAARKKEEDEDKEKAKEKKKTERPKYMHYSFGQGEHPELVQMVSRNHYENVDADSGGAGDDDVAPGTPCSVWGWCVRYRCR